jgi:hypothetical protein
MQEAAQLIQALKEGLEDKREDFRADLRLTEKERLLVQKRTFTMVAAI